MDFNNEELTMEEAMEAIDSSMKNIRVGDVVKGKVISILEKEVLVNIGYMKDGVIPLSELSFEEEVEPSNIVKEEEEIYVYIVKRDDGEGNVLLSKKRADEVKLWDALYEAKKNNETVEFKVKEAVKGGLRGEVKGLKAFMPMSMVSAHFVEDFTVYTGRELEAKVIEVDKRDSKIILSRKVIEQEEIKNKKEKFWNEIKQGEIRRGTVSKIMNFGAFVDLGEEEGLIHISELSFRKVKNANEVVTIGQAVEVYVLEVDREKKRISLSLKALGENPWDNISGEFKEGNVLEGTVTRVLEFGAFVEISEGLEGLVHVSEISDENIGNPSNILKPLDKVKVKILNIDKENKRISLSIKEAKERVVEDFSKYVDNEESSNTLGDLLGDKFKSLNLK
ncbi:30S ribosomal protein S1 [Hathewaya massiliensis]|uniref:30S ribosomal protein S1 n=1 Tax=Hathewaya massiliensis TaxID=1964382 RepID=UPI0011577827|nr:30S ribosomal protein S1 [Hathewaya massiliensis]